jgi:uncharacterized protein (TIGR01244 family)
VNRFKQLDDNVFLGPQPTEQDLHQTKQRGIKTVIDFRIPIETSTPNAGLAARKGLDNANTPVNKTSLSKDQIDELDRVMHVKNGPFLIHCATGARAAMLVSLSKQRIATGPQSAHLKKPAPWGSTLRTSPEFAAFVIAATPSGRRL